MSHSLTRQAENRAQWPIGVVALLAKIRMGIPIPLSLMHDADQTEASQNTRSGMGSSAKLCNILRVEGKLFSTT